MSQPEDEFPSYPLLDTLLLLSGALFVVIGLLAMVVGMMSDIGGTFLSGASTFAAGMVQLGIARLLKLAAECLELLRSRNQ